MNKERLLLLLKEAGTVAGTTASVLVIAGLLPSDTSQAILSKFQDIIGDLQKLIGDSYALGLLVIPIATAWWSFVKTRVTTK